MERETSQETRTFNETCAEADQRIREIIETVRQSATNDLDFDSRHYAGDFFRRMGARFQEAATTIDPDVQQK